MSSLYDRVEKKRHGGKALASARLRYAILRLLNIALGSAGKTQSELARSLHLRRSAVNQVFRGDGNLRINTLAEYLYAMGFELSLDLVEAGEPRQAALEGRPPDAVFGSTNMIIDISVSSTHTRTMLGTGLFMPPQGLDAQADLGELQRRLVQHLESAHAFQLENRQVQSVIEHGHREGGAGQFHVLWLVPRYIRWAGPAETSLDASTMLSIDVEASQ
jgi:transcriptional regulator with XRE-family HTH domain